MSILYNRFVQTIFLNVQDNWQQIIPLDDERNLLWVIAIVFYDMYVSLQCVLLRFSQIIV